MCEWGGAVRAHAQDWATVCGERAVGEFVTLHRGQGAWAVGSARTKTTGMTRCAIRERPNDTSWVRWRGAGARIARDARAGTRETVGVRYFIK